MVRFEESRDEDFEVDMNMHIESENGGGKTKKGGETSRNPESKIELEEEPTDAPDKQAAREVSSMPEVTIELTEEAVQAIENKVGVTEVC